MRKSVIFLVYLLLSSYLNVGFVGFSKVSAQGNLVFYDDFNDNSLDTAKWTEDMAGSGNTYSEENGEAHFTTYGHRTGSYTTEHAFLRSEIIRINDWDSVTFSGRWKFTDPGTAEMWFRVYDSDTGNYIGVRYISWTSTIAYDRPEGTVSDSRSAPQTYVSFRIVLYKDHLEYLEDGTLVKNVATTGMENTTGFYLLIGGWDDTPTESNIYFDDISVEYEPSQGEALKVTIISPEERVYNRTVIDLNVTANKPVDEWRYSLNGAGNVTFQPNTTIEAEEGENSLSVYAISGDEVASARVDFYVDTTPPGTVKNLSHEVGADYILWSWDNPKDEDFSGALVYIDGKFQGQTNDGEWLMEGLSPGETHTIGLLTEDRNGNVNTTWVNDTATTLTPSDVVYVNESGWWYEEGNINPSESPLSEGIGAAPAGGTVVVLAGNYTESVEIDKPLTLETEDNAVIRGDGSSRGRYKPVILVSSDNVTVLGFTINSSASNVGLWVNDSRNCLLADNTVIITESSEEERYGVYLSYGSENTVRNSRITVRGFQGEGIYLYHEEGSALQGNYLEVIGDGSNGIELFYSTAQAVDNRVHISGIGPNPGYSVLLYLADDSSLEYNELETELDEENAWALGIMGNFSGSLSGNVINGVQTEITAPGNIVLREIPEERKPVPPEGYGSAGIFLEGNVGDWMELGVYYDPSALEGLNEETLAIWRFSEGWSRDGISGDHLDVQEGIVSANVTGSGIFAPLAQEETDKAPPVLTLVPPTPENGSLLGDSSVTINVTSSEELSGATIELDGTNHTMPGSGRSWWYSTVLPDGSHSFLVHGTDLAGNNGTSERREFEVDTKAPVYVLHGQSSDGVPRGGEVLLYARWSDAHPSYSRLWTNVTGSWVVFEEGSLGEDGWSNFSVSLDEPGLYCWYIEAFDELEHSNETPTECFEVYSPPRIVSYSPESPVESYEGDVVSFSVEADQTVNVTWYVGESEVFREENVRNSTYTNSTANAGEYSVRAVVENSNGSESHGWVWYVYPKPSVTLRFVEPTPENGAMLNFRRVIINVSSSVELENATLEWNGANESMTGSGKSWWAVKDNLPDGTYTFRVYGSVEGVTNSTGERSIQIDATPPRATLVGESSEEVIEGEGVGIFARWSDEHLSSAELWTNASEGFEWTKTPLELVDGWSNWTIETGDGFAGKTFCWYIVANDTFGNENTTKPMCFRVEERLRIIAFAPEAEEITLRDNESVSFSIELNKRANITWLVNETSVLRDEGNSSTYTNSSLVPGTWNITAVAERGEERVTHSWRLVVETDRTPPGLEFVRPTPENGSLLGNGTVTFVLSSNEDLSNATLLLDGLGYPMIGEGKRWGVTVGVPDGRHRFYAIGEDLHGNANRTGMATFEVDTKAPVLLSWGQGRDIALEGEPIPVSALWDEPHPVQAVLEGNATGDGSWRILGKMDYFDWTNFTISTEGLKGLYCWRILVNDTLGRESETPLNCFRVEEHLMITNFSPEDSEVGFLSNKTAVFSIVLNRGANVTWLINGSRVFGEEGTSSTYTNSSLIPGLWNITVIAETEREGVSHSWLMRVEEADTRAPVLAFVPPTPENGSLTNRSEVVFRLSADEELYIAILELDGTNYTMSGSDREWSLTLTLEDGVHSFRAYASDVVGNLNSTETRVFAVDTIPPKIAVNAPGTVERTEGANATVTFRDTNPANYTILLDGVVVAEGNFSDGEAVTLGIPTESTGVLEYKVLARDGAGNLAEKNFTVKVVDTTPPAIQFLPPTPENGSILNVSEVEFRINSSEELSRAVLLSSEGRFNGTELERDGAAWSVTLTLPDGEYTFRVKGWDISGNPGFSGERSITVDTTSPSLSFLEPTPENGSLIKTREINVSISSNEELLEAMLEFDGENHTMSGSGRNWSLVVTAQNDGVHSFRVHGKDPAGNWNSTETRVIVVDSTPPNIGWVHPFNMTPTGGGTYRAERLSNAGFMFNVTEAHPGGYSVSLRQEPGKPWKILLSGSYSSGVPFGFAISTDEVGVTFYHVVIADAAGNFVALNYAVNVSDTTPPGEVLEPSVRTDSTGFTISWRNPTDDDFERVELYLDPKIEEGAKGEKVIHWEASLIANLSGLPGEEMSYSRTAAHGDHVLYMRTFDSYGNGGNFTRIEFNVPLPTFTLRYLKPTPQNGDEIRDDAVEIAVEASVELSSCTLTWNGEDVPMRISGKSCSITMTVVPGANYTFRVSAMDRHFRRRTLEERHFSVPGACFGEGSGIEMTSPVSDPMSLRFPVSFLFRTNTLAMKYSYEVDVDGKRISGEFSPVLELISVEESNGKTYTFNGTFLLDLWSARDQVIRAMKEGRPLEVSLNLLAFDACKKVIEAGKSFQVCGNAEEPKFWVDLKDFYYGDDDVIIRAHYENLTPVEAFYYSINGGNWVEFNGTANLTGALARGSNTVMIKAITPCGLERVKKYRIFIGPGRNEDWVVNTTEGCDGVSFAINGSLRVTENGSLEMRNCKLTITGGVEVNGTLRVLENSLIGGESLFLSGNGGKIEVSHSELNGFSRGTFEGGNASFERSLLAGEFTFRSSNVSIVESEVNGGVTASGSLTVMKSRLHGGTGLGYERTGQGVLVIKDSNFTNSDYGIKFSGVASDWNWEMENLLVENNRYAGFYLEAPRYGYSTELLRNVTVRNNPVGIYARNVRLRVENSNVSSNGANFVLHLGWNWIFIVNSTVGGSDRAFQAWETGGIELWDTNVSGSVDPDADRFIVHVTRGATVRIEDGRAKNFQGYVDGKLVMKSYTAENGIIKVSPEGKLIVEDRDGIPATEAMDRDASRLVNMNVTGMANGRGESQLILLNSVLRDSNVHTNSREAIVKGCSIEGGSLAFTTSPGVSRNLIISEVFGDNAEWYYSTTELGNSWVYTPSTEGMQPGNGPFAANIYSSGFTSGTEVGEFTGLYLKRVFNLTELPVQAWLDYYAISGVEIYVNGRKVVDEIDHRAQLSFTQGWGGGRITAHPLTGLVDVAGYLRQGRNVIAVHVGNPNEYPYPGLGAFKARLSVVTGAAGVTDSRIKARIGGGRAMLILARDEMMGNVTALSNSWLRISDSTVHGGVRVYGHLELLRSTVEGNGTGTGVMAQAPFEILLNDSRVRNFECGINASPWGTKSKLEVYSSEISGNNVGIALFYSSLIFESSYLVHNGVGMEMGKVDGMIHNSLLFDNGKAVTFPFGPNWNFTFDHNTVIGNGIGIEFTEHGDRPFSATNNLIQDNGIGVSIRAHVNAIFTNNSLINGKGIYVSSIGTPPRLTHTDWGGHEPKMVEDYPSGTMYTASGEAEENYDILSLAKGMEPGDTVETGSNWGSDLLLARLSIHPEENGTVRGVVSLEGIASSSSGVSLVNYSLIINGTEELLKESEVNDAVYHDYVTLDTVARNLTGTGYIKFTAKDGNGMSVSSVRKVYFGNAEIRIESYSVSHPTALYVYRKVSDDGRTVIPYEERFANVTVRLANIGSFDGAAKIELVLPEYIERHTGRVNLIVAIPANMSGDFHALVPITVYNPITLTWDPLPEELPESEKIPMEIKLYDMDGILRDSRTTEIGFDIGPVFRLEKYDAYVLTRSWCQDSGECHKKNYGRGVYTYDGDGDGILEAAESHHFNFMVENIGTREVYLEGMTFFDCIPERDPYHANKVLKRNSVTILNKGSGVFLSDVTTDNLRKFLGPGEKMWANGVWMPWWDDRPPRVIPPVNFSGEYMSTVFVYYRESRDGLALPQVYLSPAVNYRRTPVASLNKTFEQFTEFVGPIKVDVIGINGDKTYLRLKNTNDNVYYNYYAEGYYDLDPEGYVWYHAIPPGFEFKVTVGHSRMPDSVIPHYRVTVGAEHSLLFNEIHLIAIGAEGALKVYDIDVPVETLVMALVKAFLKITNIVENLDFPSDQTIAEYSRSSSAAQVNEMLSHDNSTIVPLSLDDFARWEKEGLNQSYYYKMEHFSEQPLETKVELFTTLGKAIVTDEDMQALFIETVLEVIDNDALNDIYEVIQAIREGNADKAESNGMAIEQYGLTEDDLDEFKKVVKKALVKYVKDEIKKQKSFQELDEEKQKEILDKAGKGVGAAIETAEKLGEWTAYNVIAILTQPLPMDINVLDPPSNYTVEAQKGDSAIIFGGSSGNLDGWGNVSLTFGDIDVYRAHYIVPTPLTRIGPLFNGSFERVSLLIRGQRDDNGMKGTVIMEIKPDARNASALFAIFRNEYFARAFISPYLSGMERFEVAIENNTVVIEGEGTLTALPEDREMSINVTFGKLLTEAVVERKGHYSGTLEVRPAFGVSPEKVHTSIGGNVSKGTLTGGTVVASRNTTEKPELSVFPVKLYAGGTVGIGSSVPCALNWSLGKESGSGSFVKTTGLKPGNYTLRIVCIAGNSTFEESFEIELIEKPPIERKADGVSVSGNAGETLRISTRTDLYRIYFQPAGKISGQLAVYQMPGTIKAPEGYRYLTYALFNVTHPANWSMSNITLHFRVSKEWLGRNKVSPDKVLLLHYENGWVEYKPAIDHEDLSYVHYRASVSALSLFAVVEKVRVEKPGETETETPVESPAETSSAPEETGTAPPTEENPWNMAYYLMGFLVLLALVAYLYRRR